MSELLLKCDQDKWRQDLSLLLPIAKANGHLRARCSDLINQVLFQSLQQAVTQAGNNVERCGLALNAAVSHVLPCLLEDRQAFDIQDPSNTISQATQPADPAASLDWCLVDMTGNNAAIFLNLTPVEAAQFKGELRSRVLMELARRKSAPQKPQISAAENS